MPYGTTTLGALSHTPQRLLASTWLGYLGLYFLGPVHYHRSLALVTVVFVLACNGGFILGAAGVARHHGRPRAADGRFLPALDRSIRLFAVVGILGAGLVVADKLLGGRVDFSEGLGVTRLQLQGTLEDEPFRPRSVVLWVGTLVYSFSNAALVLYILHGRVSRRTAAWVVVSSFSPAAVILMYAGRSSAFVTLLLVFSAGLVRLACGQPLLPRAHYLRALLAIHLALLSGGSLYVFASRGAALGVGGGGALKRLVVNLDATLSSSVEQRIEEEGAAGALTANSLPARSGGSTRGPSWSGRCRS